MAGTNAFRRHWTWPCLARAKQGGLQDLAVYDVGGDDIRSSSRLRPPSHRSSATQQQRSNATMEWVMARPRIPFVQKQIPFLSFRAHGRGICILWRPVIRQSAASPLAIACRSSNRLVAHLSQRSPSFRRYGWSFGWTHHGFSCLGTAGASGRPISEAFLAWRATISS